MTEDKTPQNQWVGATGGKPFNGSAQYYFTTITGVKYGGCIEPSGMPNEWRWSITDLDTKEEAYSDTTTREEARKAVENWFSDHRKHDASCIAEDEAFEGSDAHLQAVASYEAEKQA